MATHFGVRCDSDHFEAHIEGQIRAHVQIVDCAAAVTLSATYRLESDGTSGSATTTSFYFPRIINDQNHVIHGLKAEFKSTHGNSGVAMVYLDKNNVDKAIEDVENNGDIAVVTAEPSNDQHVFKCPLAQVSGTTEVVVTFNYSCELTPEGHDTVRLWMPDLSLQGKPTTGKLDFTAQIRSSYSVDKVESGIAQFQVWTFDNGVTDVSLLNNDDVGSDIDMAITYKNMDQIPALAIEKPEQNSTGLGWNSKTVAMLTVTPDLSDATQSMGGALGEYIFVVDRSGSMSGDRIAHAKETLLLFLKSLPVGCYFNIVGFGSSYEVLFNGGSDQYNGATLERAMTHQKRMSANLGGTNLNRPLQHIFTGLPVVKGYPRHIFVMTDGRISDTDGTVQLVKDNAKHARVHSFGIGFGADMNLVRRLAEAGGGVHDSVEAFDRTMESKVMDALREAMTACATNLKVDWKLPKGVSAVPVFREPVKRPLIDGEHRAIYYDITGEVDGKLEGKCSVSVSYEVDGVKKAYSVPIQDSSTKNLMLIHRLAAVQKIKQLETCANQEAVITAFSEEMNLESAGVTVGCRRLNNNLLAACIQGTTATPGCSTSPPATAPTPFGFGASRVGAGAASTPARGGGGVRRPAQRRVFRDNIENALNSNAIKRIMHRGGVARKSCLVNDEIRGCLKIFLSKLIKDSVLYAENGRRKTVNQEDVDAALKKNGVKLYGIEERSIYPFEDQPVVGRRRVVYRTTPVGRPDATASTVASLLGVTAPLPKPVPLAKQRTKDLSQVSSNIAKNSLTSSMRLTKSKSGNSTSSMCKDRSRSRSPLSRSPSSSSRSGSQTGSPSTSRQPSLNKRVSLTKSTSNTSGVSVSAGAGVISPTMARQDSSVSTTSSQPVSMTVTKPAVSRVTSTTGSSSPGPSVSSTTTPRGGRKRKGSDDGAPKAKQQKKAAAKKTPKAAKTPKKAAVKKNAGAAAAQKASMSRTRSQRTSIVGPSGASGAAFKKPDFTDMINLITLQTFDGSWDLSKNLAAILGKPVEKLTTLAPDPNLSLKVWATVLSVEWLTTHFPEARPEYEMIYDKGLKWIQSQDLKGLTLQELQKYAKLSF